MMIEWFGRGEKDVRSGHYRSHPFKAEWDRLVLIQSGIAAELEGQHPRCRG